MKSLLKIEEPSLKHASSNASWRDFLELGFRPLYLGGAIWAIVGVGFWVFAPHWLQGILSGVFWHAHEMLWGFVAAIAVGFLLTATNNWTGINPLHGKALGALACLWLIARIGYLLPHPLAFGMACAAESLFFCAATYAVARCLWRAQSQHNYALPALVLGMGLANAAFLYACWMQWDYSTLMHHLFAGMLCMLTLTLIVARRVIPFFASRAVSGLELNRHTRSGQWQAGCAALAIASWLFDFNTVSALLFTAASLITLWHLVSWKPWAVLGTPLLWILYLGYLGLGLGLAAAAAYTLDWSSRLSWPVHLIAMAGFGALILGMITRTALGHTGRLLRADKAMVTAFALLLIAIILRVCALSTNTATMAWLHASATCWMLAFAIYLVRFIPMMTRPRVDKHPGKPINLSRS